jgi:hypothetical protein
MAVRPIFIPSHNAISVEEIPLQIRWHSGFAPIQKKRNVEELHCAAAAAGFSPLLEISTKSEVDLGRDLSAFNLQVEVPDLGSVSLESAFQSSKVFEDGGPFSELIDLSPREARSDERLRSSGPLVEFRFRDMVIPREPKTLFYDWLYIRALASHPEWHSVLLEYSGFTDIEFNPERSLNCQARSCALFVSLLQHNLLKIAVASPASLKQVSNGYAHVALPMM